MTIVVCQIYECKGNYNGRCMKDRIELEEQHDVATCISEESE